MFAQFSGPVSFLFLWGEGEGGSYGVYGAQRAKEAGWLER